MAVRVAVDLFETNPEHFKKMSDTVISALLIHDCFKCGLEYDTKTSKEHDIICAKYAEQFINEEVALAVLAHMGMWGSKKPETSIEMVVHRCDYIASRKWCSYLPV